MIEVEQKLKLVKRLLQEKVNQLREQVSLPSPSHAPHAPGLTPLSRPSVTINSCCLIKANSPECLEEHRIQRAAAKI